MSQERRVVVVELSGRYRIEGVLGTDETAPSELSYNGYRYLLTRVEPRYVLYREVAA